MKKKNKRFTSYNIKQAWADFWYEWHYPSSIRFGGGPQGWKSFRWQRLFNIAIATIVLCVLIILL